MTGLPPHPEQGTPDEPAHGVIRTSPSTKSKFLLVCLGAIAGASLMFVLLNNNILGNVKNDSADIDAKIAQAVAKARLLEVSNKVQALVLAGKLDTVNRLTGEVYAQQSTWQQLSDEDKRNVLSTVSDLFNGARSFVITDLTRKTHLASFSTTAGIVLNIPPVKKGLTPDQIGRMMQANLGQQQTSSTVRQRVPYMNLLQGKTVPEVEETLKSHGVEQASIPMPELPNVSAGAATKVYTFPRNGKPSFNGTFESGRLIMGAEN